MDGFTHTHTHIHTRLYTHTHLSLLLLRGLSRPPSRCLLGDSDPTLRSQHNRAMSKAGRRVRCCPAGLRLTSSCPCPRSRCWSSSCPVIGT
jgi:hypothetical protein